MRFGVPAGRLGGSGASGIAEHLADRHRLRQSGQTGERDGKFRMSFSLSDKILGRSRGGNVPRGGELGRRTARGAPRRRGSGRPGRARRALGSSRPGRCRAPR